jgi:hypothetical protein
MNNKTIDCPKPHCKCMYGAAAGCPNHHYGQGCPLPWENKPTPNPQEKMYIGSIGGVPIISDPKATEPHFRDPLTSDPQETVQSQFEQWQNDPNGGPDFDKYRETLPNTQSPKLAEPHVVQSHKLSANLTPSRRSLIPEVPQESSPGFEEVLDRVLTDYRMTSRLEDEDGGERYARKNAKNPILAAHNSAIQAAKREEQQLTLEALDQLRPSKQDMPYMVVLAVKKMITNRIKHLEEETT